MADQAQAEQDGAAGELRAGVPGDAPTPDYVRSREISMATALAT
ncbi:MAG: hypothetical protein ACRECY_08335 [Phyllobacterium sp.]